MNKDTLTVILNLLPYNCDDWISVLSVCKQWKQIACKLFDKRIYPAGFRFYLINNSYKTKTYYYGKLKHWFVDINSTIEAYNQIINCMESSHNYRVRYVQIYCIDKYIFDEFEENYYPN